MKNLTPTQKALLQHAASVVSFRSIRNPGAGSYHLMEMPDGLRATIKTAEALVACGYLARKRTSMWSAEFCITDAGRAYV